MLYATMEPVPLADSTTCALVTMYFLPPCSTMKPEPEDLASERSSTRRYAVSSGDAPAAPNIALVSDISVTATVTTPGITRSSISGMRAVPCASAGSGHGDAIEPTTTTDAARNTRKKLTGPPAPGQARDVRGTHGCHLH